MKNEDPTVVADLPKRALVTGATGYVGTALCRRLASDGWQVTAMVRAESSKERTAALASMASLYEYDGSRESLLRPLQERAPSIVFHLASLFLAEHRPEDVARLISSNVLLGTQLLDAMVEARSFRLVTAGSYWQHYQNEDYNPVCLYAATKEAFEAILRYYWETSPLQAVVLHLFDVYGPDDPRQKLFALLRRTAAEMKPLAMSPGDQLLDLVYVDDVVEAFVVAARRLLAAESGVRERYAVSSGRPVSLKEVVEKFERSIDVRLPIQWGGRPYRSREVMVPWNRGTPLPGWSPLVSLEEGLRRLARHGR